MTDVTSTVTPTPLSPTLTAGDRCDRCGAQAYVRAVLAVTVLVFLGTWLLQGRAIGHAFYHAMVILVDEPKASVVAVADLGEPV